MAEDTVEQGAAAEAKLRAEAEKALAEAKAANEQAEYYKASVLKAGAEQEQAMANAAKAAAEAKKFEIETSNIEQQNRLVRIAADAASREEQDHLATDRFHHIYQFGSSVTDTSVKSCINQLTQWQRKDPGCEVEIVFNSPGGSVVDGMALYDYIQFMRAQGHQITTSAIGMAASMAGILLQAGDKRVMGRQAWLMIHEASFAALGKMGEVEDTVEWVKKVQERILDIFAERSTMTKAQIKKNWLRKDWWLSSDDALKYGFVDELR